MSEMPKPPGGAAQTKHVEVFSKPPPLRQKGKNYRNANAPKLREISFSPVLKLQLIQGWGWGAALSRCVQGFGLLSYEAP